MNSDHANNEIKKNIVRLTSLNYRRDAALRLFDAACIDNDAKQMDYQRAQLHLILDEQLDIAAANGVLCRYMIKDQGI